MFFYFSLQLKENFNDIQFPNEMTRCIGDT